MNKTASNGLMGMIGILVAASPIFAGFLMAGYSIFHDDPYFDTVDKMMISLGSLITGDEVLGTLRIAGFKYGVTGYIFTYAYSFVFFYMIKNVVIRLITTTFMKQLKLSKIQSAIKISGEINEKPKLNRGNMITTHMLRMNQALLLKDRLIAKGKNMFEANLKYIENEISNSIQDKLSLDFIKITGNIDILYNSISEFE